MFIAVAGIVGTSLLWRWF